MDKPNQIKSTFQLAAITRPLMSVSKVCDQGMTVRFDKEKAVVLNQKNEEVCKLPRQGGLYTMYTQLQKPDAFVGQGN